jgi:hypothetical protein
MKIILILLLSLILYSCSNEDPKIFGGSANVLITDGEISDTLNRCYCWRAGDSLSVNIGREGFSGISIEITNKEGKYISMIKYWSDTDQYDGQFEMYVNPSKEHLNIGYEKLSDSSRVYGNVNLTSNKVTYFKDGRIVKAKGKFECKLNN